MFLSQLSFPIIDIGDFILREQQDEDIADFFSYYSDKEVSKHILSEIPKNIEEARHELYYWRNIFYNNGGIYFAIASKKNNRLIGTIGLSSYSSYNSRIEISYDMSKEFWRKGIMTKAIKAILDYSFITLKINRVEAITSIYNEASIRLLEKCGFVYEGCLRQHRYHLGKYVDVYSFSILRNDFL